MATSAAAAPIRRLSAVSSVPPPRWRRKEAMMSTPIKEKGLSRLDFLKASGALVIAFSLPLTLKSGAAEAAGHGAFAPVNPAEMDAWLAIGPDGTVTLFTGKVELGGGVLTGF